MAVKISFNTKNFENELKKSIEKDLKKNPEKILDMHTGKPLSSPCPNCGESKLLIDKAGKAKCRACKHTVNINIDLNWK